MNANSGYRGWSMSVRAAEAYENDEMPKSRWTKRAMLARIREYCDDYGAELSDAAIACLEGLSKDELFRRFFYRSSWHHTSKFFNATDFYALDESALDEYIERPVARTYHIVFSHSGNLTSRSHKVRSRKTYKTFRLAEKRLERAGFCEAEYGYRKGPFFAAISFDEVEV